MKKKESYITIKIGIHQAKDLERFLAGACIFTSYSFKGVLRQIRSKLKKL